MGISTPRSEAFDLVSLSEGKSVKEGAGKTRAFFGDEVQPQESAYPELEAFGVDTSGPTSEPQESVYPELETFGVESQRGDPSPHFASATSQPEGDTPSTGISGLTGVQGGSEFSFSEVTEDDPGGANVQELRSAVVDGKRRLEHVDDEVRRVVRKVKQVTTEFGGLRTEFGGLTHRVSGLNRRLNNVEEKGDQTDYRFV